MESLDVTYGRGTFTDQEMSYSGTIILSRYKLFLRDAGCDVVDTYMPVEKIDRIVIRKDYADMFVRLSILARYKVMIHAQRKNLRDLVGAIVQRRCLRKKWLRNEWVESEN